MGCPRGRRSRVLKMAAQTLTLGRLHFRPGTWITRHSSRSGRPLAQKPQSRCATRHSP
jgi:hypothetical protein